MLLRVVSCLLFANISLYACCQSALIGNWRRINNKPGEQETIDKRPKFGDLQIRKDSTIHIEGDSITQISTKPGWHSGEQYNGKWQMPEANI